jgi:RimJ/RimL family protein N-acetyltransferase
MLELRRFEKDDCKYLTQWVPDARFLVQWAGPHYVFPLTVGQVEETFRRTLEDKPEHLMFKAVRVPGDEAMGHIELMRIDDRKKSAHIGRVLIFKPEVRGKGYGGRMVSLLTDLAFSTMDIRELTLNVFDFNKQAIACYMKIGFRLCDFMENAVYIMGESWNLMTMKLKKDYWIARPDTS